MVLAALLVLTQSSPITFKSEALPLKKLMPDLAKATGMPLVVSPEVQWQVVYIRVKDVSTSDLLKQIAKVTFGTWETTADGRQLLKRDEGAFKRMAEEKRIERLEALQAGIKNVLDPKSKAGATQVVLARMTQKVGLNTLASLGENQRIVFSSNPTSMQRPMPGIDVSLFHELILSHNKGVDQATARGTTEMDEEMKKYEAQLPPEFIKAMKDMEESMRPKRIPGEPAKIDLAYSNQYGIMVTLKMYDAKGDELASFEATLNGAMEEVTASFGAAAAVTTTDLRRLPPTEQGATEVKPVPDKSPVIKLSKESAEILALTYFEEGNYTPGKASADLKKRVEAIGEKDPFLAAHTELLNGYAEHVKDNLVLNVSDNLMDYRSTAQITVNAVDADLMPEKKDGWAISVPEEYEPRADRDLLVTAVSKVKNGSELTIDDKAWLAANDDRLGGPAGGVKSKIYEVFAINGYMWMNKPLLKLYGMLNASQRNAALGKGLAISSLLPDQRRLVERICYEADLFVKPYGSGQDFDEEAMFAMDFEEAMKKQMARMNISEDYLNEPTESMPAGVPKDAVLILERKSDAVFLPVIKTEEPNVMDFMGAMGGVTLDMLAGMMSLGEIMGQPTLTGQMPTTVKHAVRDSLRMKLNCTEKVGYEELHRSAKADASGKVTKITDLPEFNTKLALRKEQMKKWKPMFEFGIGFGRSSTPPPSRL